MVRDHTPGIKSMELRVPDRRGSNSSIVREAEMPVRTVLLRSVSEVTAEQWDGLLPPGAPPFLRWGWIHALEASESATAERGWEPSHLAVRRGDRLVAVAPTWVKSHSMGEYIYDFGWANAARQMGVQYYPKLVVGVPLGPIGASKLLVGEGPDAPELRELLVAGLIELARERECSSIHALFLSDDEARLFERAGFFRRLTLQFHWRNPGYRTYEDFLSRFTAKRRHQLRRERAAASEQGVSIETVRGDSLTRAHADRAFRFYEATNERNPWGHVQLTRDFFRGVFAAFPGSVEVVEASRKGKVIAGAFNVAHGDRLFGASTTRSTRASGWTGASSSRARAASTRSREASSLRPSTART
jgi:uncharacterized protein